MQVCRHASIYACMGFVRLLIKLQLQSRLHCFCLPHMQAVPVQSVEPCMGAATAMVAAEGAEYSSDDNDAMVMYYYDS